MLGIRDRSLGPSSGINIAGLLSAHQQIHRHHRKLQRGAPLQKQHIKFIGHTKHRSDQIYRLVMDRNKMFAPMTHFDQGHTGAMIIDELSLTLLEDG